MADRYDAVIVGAGHNGLVTAGYLAGAGLSVLVLERRDVVGGSCVTEELFPGFRVSSCSYICHLLQRKVVDDLELSDHGLRIHTVDPYRFQPFPDGRYMLTWQDPERTREEVSRIHRADGKAYPAFYEFWRRAAGIIHRHFLSSPPTLEELIAECEGTGDEPVLGRMLTGNLVDLVTEHFRSDLVRATFLDAEDAGNPRAPGSVLAQAYNMVDLLTEPDLLGIPHGGMGGITQAMAASAEARGAEIRTGVEVDRIVVRDGRASGVVLGDGTVIECGLVISNADPKRTFGTLVDRHGSLEDYGRSLSAMSTRAGYLKFHCALSALPDFSRYIGGRTDLDDTALAQVRLSPSIESFELSWMQARSGVPADEPVMHIQIPSVYDASLVAEGGRHVMSVWALYAPVRPSKCTWDELREPVGESMIDVIGRYAPGFRDLVIDWSLFTPSDLEERMYLTDGNIRHLDMVAGQMFSDRLGYETPIKGLYLCGAGTHPGGEVTGAPGHNAAAAVLAALEGAGPA